MVTRVHLGDEDEANELASRIDEAGHEVAVIQERFAGEDDDEEVEFVVATTARRRDVEALVSDPQVFVEED